MSCPRYNKYSRECNNEISSIPEDTSSFCATEKFSECPFFRILRGDTNVCKNIKVCFAFKYFKTMDFGRFLSVSENYCTSDYRVCKRYIKKESGDKVPDNLHPDGSTLDLN